MVLKETSCRDLETSQEFFEMSHSQSVEIIFLSYEKETSRVQLETSQNYARILLERARLYEISQKF